MKRVETQLIKSSHPQYKRIDELCFLSKNLYNCANYIIRQEFIQNNRWIQYHELERGLRTIDHPDYVILPNNTSQQILMILDKNWKSFFKAIKQWKKNPSLFSGKPSLPRYKDKQKGRNLLSFSINQCKIKNGLLHFPKKTGLTPIPTKQTTFNQIRIIPLKNKSYKLEIVYEKEININKTLSGTYVGIDIGINNLMTLTSNDPGFQPTLINGRPLKSTNQYYNKKKSDLQSKLTKQFPNRHSSRKIESLTVKRNHKVSDYIHKATRKVVTICQKHNVDSVVIGLNKQWKQDCNIGKKNNQNFVSIPHSKMIDILQYKLEECGINLIVREESYTSKCSFLDLESIEKHESYAGKRVKRGLFISSTGIRINSDVNGSYNILRKEFGDVVRPTDRGLRFNPVRVSV